MKIQVLPKERHGHKELLREAVDLDDALAKGLFSGGMPRDEFMHRITHKNVGLRTYHSATHTGLFDSERDMFVCGISRMSRIPRFTIMKYDTSKDKTIQYTDEHGNKTSKNTVNTDDEQGKVLARSWISVFNMLKARGYEIEDSDIDY